MTEDALFCSFHTPDDYYANSAKNLRNSLERLGISHDIVEISKQPGEEWLEICRKKIPFLHAVCEKNPNRKIFWIDVDCDIDYLPDFISEFTADIIGFQRGFGHPIRIGYANSARFWEPCFWGINTTKAARTYIRDAYNASETMTVRATDDFFFEESWRKNADQLTYQLIPSSMVLGKPESSAQERRPFFYFGSSGNVPAFKGLAAQHNRTNPINIKHSSTTVKSTALNAARKIQGILPRRLSVPLRRLSDEVGLTEYLSPTLPTSRQLSSRSIYSIIHDARDGRKEQVEKRLTEITSRRMMNATDQAVVAAANAFLEYSSSEDSSAIPLLWWDKPYPGNYGDWLSPLIIRHVARKPVKFHRHDEINPQPHLLSIGSIGKFAQETSVVAGSGFSRSDTEISTRATYVSLRGPYSAKLLSQAGGAKVDQFGDPAVLLPRIINLNRSNDTNGRIALVRHFAHRNISLRLPDNVTEYSVLQSNPENIRELIKNLLRYDGVLTSAMHIYITCQAYGVPVGLVTFDGFEDAVSGDGIKYRDYASGVGLPERVPEVISHDLRHRKLDNLINSDRISDAVMDEVERALKEAIMIMEQRFNMMDNNKKRNLS